MYIYHSPYGCTTWINLLSYIYKMVVCIISYCDIYVYRNYIRKIITETFLIKNNTDMSVFRLSSNLNT